MPAHLIVAFHPDKIQHSLPEVLFVPVLLLQQNSRIPVFLLPVGRKGASAHGVHLVELTLHLQERVHHMVRRAIHRIDRRQAKHTAHPGQRHKIADLRQFPGRVFHAAVLNAGNHIGKDVRCLSLGIQMVHFIEGDPQSHLALQSPEHGPAVSQVEIHHLPAAPSAVPFQQTEGQLEVIERHNGFDPMV